MVLFYVNKNMKYSIINGMSSTPKPAYSFTYTHAGYNYALPILLLMPIHFNLK